MCIISFSFRWSNRFQVPKKALSRVLFLEKHRQRSICVLLSDCSIVYILEHLVQLTAVLVAPSLLSLKRTLAQRTNYYSLQSSPLTVILPVILPFSPLLLLGHRSPLSSWSILHSLSRQCPVLVLPVTRTLLDTTPLVRCNSLRSLGHRCPFLLLPVIQTPLNIIPLIRRDSIALLMFPYLFNRLVENEISGGCEEIRSRQLLVASCHLSSNFVQIPMLPSRCLRISMRSSQLNQPISDWMRFGDVIGFSKRRCTFSPG